jgi:hypothetical protein
MKRNSLRFYSQVIPGPPENRKRRCPEEERFRTGQAGKTGFWHAFFSPKTLKNIFVFRTISD